MLLSNLINLKFNGLTVKYLKSFILLTFVLVLLSIARPLRVLISESKSNEVDLEYIGLSSSHFMDSTHLYHLGLLLSIFN